MQNQTRMEMSLKARLHLHAFFHYACRPRKYTINFYYQKCTSLMRNRALNSDV